MNQFCTRCEPFVKQNSAASKNGVVGSIGRKTPTTPSPTKTKPIIISIDCIIRIKIPIL